MKKLLQSFVSEYKVILNMKKEHEYKGYNPLAIKNTLISTSLMFPVFFGFGYLLNLMENLHYLIIGLYFIIFLNFIIYNHTREIVFQKQFKLEYKPIYGYFFELSFLITILSLSNFLLTIFVYKNDVNIVLTILLGLISIIHYIIYYSYRFVSYFKHYNRLNPSIKVLWVLILYLLLYFMLDISSIGISYLLSTLIIYFIILIKNTFLFYGKRYVKIRNTVSYSLLIISIIFIIFFGDINKPETLYTYHLNTTESNLELDINKLFIHDDLIYTYDEDDVLYEYDKDLNLIRSIHPDLDDIEFYYFDSAGDLKVVVRDPNQEDVYGSSWSERYRAIQYDITDVNNPIEEFTLPYLRDRDYTPIITDYEGSIYDITLNYYNENYPILGEDKEAQFPDIIYQDEYTFAYANGDDIRRFSSNRNDIGYLTYASYSNNKMLINITGEGTYIVDTSHIDEWNDYKSQIDFDESVYDVDSFYFDGNNYYINVHADENYLNDYGSLYIYDNDYNLIAQIDNTGEIFFTNNFFYQVLYDDENQPISYQILDSENLYTKSTSKTLLLDTASFILIMLFLISLNIEIPGFDIRKVYLS